MTKHHLSKYLEYKKDTSRIVRFEENLAI